MLTQERASFGHRLIRTLIPSPISAVACLCGGVSIVALFMLLKSVTLGTSLPDIFDGEWGVLYTNTIVQPLTTIFNNDDFNKVFIIFIWGLLGLVVYLVIEHGTRIIKNLREAETDVQVTAEKVVFHAGLKEFLTVFFWRVGVLAIFSCVAVFVVQPALAGLAILAPTAVLGGASSRDAVEIIVLLVVSWTVIAHLSVVFLRLFLMRVRLFSDDPY